MPRPRSLPPEVFSPSPPISSLFIIFSGFPCPVPFRSMRQMAALFSHRDARPTFLKPFVPYPFLTPMLSAALPKPDFLLFELAAPIYFVCRCFPGSAAGPLPPLPTDFLSLGNPRWTAARRAFRRGIISPLRLFGWSQASFKEEFTCSSFQ